MTADPSNSEPAAVPEHEMESDQDVLERGANYGKLEKLKATDLIDPPVLRRLSRRSPSAVLLRMGFDYGLIVAAAALCELYWHPLLYVLAIMTIGARQVGIGSVALHDGVHRLLFRNGSLNDRVGRFMCASVGVPIFDDFYGYRKRHYQHHRLTNTEEDPELWLADQFYGMTRGKALLLLLLALSGLLFLRAFAAFLSRKWKTSKAASLGVAALAIALITAAVLGFYPAVLLVMYWILPLATWGLFINVIRGVAEHYPIAEYQRGEEIPEVFRTRDVLNSWFDQIFVVTRGVNYHLSHHLVPSVPFYRLPDLQRELAKSDLYRRYSHVTRGYHRFLWEYFCKRSEPVGMFPEAIER